MSLTKQKKGWSDEAEGCEDPDRTNFNNAAHPRLDMYSQTQHAYQAESVSDKKIVHNNQQKFADYLSQISLPESYQHNN